jgi:hypothetical protein
MSRGCELRQISQEDAQLFVRLPEKLLALERARHEAYKNRSYTEEVADPTRQFHDWHVLMALVSGSAAWTLLVKSGQQVGETEQMWEVLDADVRVLSISQVQALNNSLEGLLAEEDEQALIDLAMAEQANKPLLTPSTAPAEEWTLYDAGPEEQWLQWHNPGPSQAEIDLTLHRMLKQLQQFIQAAVEARSALLIIA